MHSGHYSGNLCQKLSGDEFPAEIWQITGTGFNWVHSQNFVLVLGMRISFKDWVPSPGGFSHMYMCVPFTKRLAHNYNMQISRYTSHTLSRAQNWPIACVGSGKIWWKKPHEYRFRATWKWSWAKAIHIWQQSLHFQLHRLNYPKSQLNLDLKSQKNEICVC